MIEIVLNDITSLFVGEEVGEENGTTFHKVSLCVNIWSGRCVGLGERYFAELHSLFESATWQ